MTNPVNHVTSTEAVNAWDGAATIGPVIDPWNARGVTFRFHVRNISGNANFIIECADADPNDDTQPAATWTALEYKTDPCDASAEPESASIDIGTEHNGSVVSVEFPICPGCKFLRVRLGLGVADTADEVRVIAELHDLRNGG